MARRWKVTTQVVEIVEEREESQWIAPAPSYETMGVKSALDAKHCVELEFEHLLDGVGEVSFEVVAVDELPEESTGG